MRPVALLATQGDAAVVKSGVKAGDVVVTDGQMVLTNGSLVKIAPATAGGPAS
jgi:multidrug efflux pump subunit AcrA (membrane-fusion protein)